LTSSQSAPAAAPVAASAALMTLKVEMSTSPTCAPAGAHSDSYSSIDARRVYAKDLGLKTVSPGSIHRALRSLVDLHVLTKPAGSRGHYGFDDPMFREWLSRQTSDSDDASEHMPP